MSLTRSVLIRKIFKFIYFFSSVVFVIPVAPVVEKCLWTSLLCRKFWGQKKHKTFHVLKDDKAAVGLLFINTYTMRSECESYSSSFEKLSDVRSRRRRASQN